MKQEEMFIIAAQSVIFSLSQHCFLCREREGVVFNFFFFFLLLKYPLLVHNADQSSTVHANHG